MSKRQRKNAGSSEPKTQIRAAVDKAKEVSRARISSSVKTSRRAIQKRPLTAVGVATGAAVAVGIIAGVSLARRGKNNKNEAAEEDED